MPTSKTSGKSTTKPKSPAPAMKTTRTRAKPTKRTAAAPRRRPAPEETELDASLNAFKDLAQSVIDTPEPTVGELFQPSLDLSLCIGHEARTLEGLALDLSTDLEQMRWDNGSLAVTYSKILGELQALVDEAGGPHRVALEKLLAFAARHSAPVGTPQSLAYRKAIALFRD